MTFGENYDLYKTFAIEHVDIQHTEENKHFGCYSASQMLSREIKDMAAGYALIIERPEGRIHDLKSDDKLDVKTCAFHIVKFGEGRDLVENLHSVWSECERIGKEVIGRMICMAEDHDTILGFEPDSVSYMPLGIEVWGDDAASVRFEFEFKASGTKFNYNPDKWL